MSRDPCRSPVPWTASGGFCPADVAPWLPMDPNLGQTSVAQQRGDASSMLSLYRRLLRLRREHPALRVGAYETHAASDDEIYVFWRQEGDDRVLVALNFGPEWRALPVELGAPGRTLFEAEDGKAVIIEARPA
jgi:alpha-glucosidase